MSKQDPVPSSAEPGLGAPADRSNWEEVAAFLGRAETHGLDSAPVRIDTHAAAVFLAGPLAYKIKRPVRFPFLDFSTLAAREVACRREIAVDRPIAPQIYRRVVAITRGPDGSLRIGGDGEAVEWAVEMNRFDETATLDRMTGKGPLSRELVDQLAATVARAQARASRRDAGPWIADLGTYLRHNDEAFAGRPDLFPPQAAAALLRRAEALLGQLDDLLRARGRLGLVRLGHGDLHCGNIAVIDGKAQPFDAIEFDDAIATGDILYDAGFLVMDLADRGNRASACRLLNRLLIETTRLETPGRDAGARAAWLLDEIDGLAAMPLFLSIRAGLRAKIAAARAEHLTEGARRTAEGEARRLFAAARAHLEPAEARLVAVGGLSGSGKSTLARGLAPSLDPAPGAVVLRSDEIRKLLAGVTSTTRLPPEHYTAESSTRVYDLIGRAASRALAVGRSVIVDAVAVRPDERAWLAGIAAGCEARFDGLWLDVSREVALERVGGRRSDASDADADVVDFQLGLDAGAIDWHRIDADGTPEETLAAAIAAIRPRAG